MYKSIRPAKYWYDTAGKRIQAHGGSIIYAEDKFFWYGENKEGVTGRALGEPCKIWHNGVRVYSSQDLYNWTDEGVVMVDKQDINSPFNPECIMDRPHILYNSKTKKYVMWAKIAGLLHGGGGFENGYFAVCTSDKINGKFTLIGKRTNYPVGDFDLVEEDGKGYIIFEKPHTEMLCATLTDDYTDFASEPSSHLQLPYPPFVREAPAYFTHNGRKFLLTSGTTGYFPNKSEIAEITSFHGEWKTLGNPCKNDLTDTSFHAQFSSVFRHPKKKDLYIALGDRWLTDVSEQTVKIDDIFEEWFSNSKDKKYNPSLLTKYSDENTSEATYVWLPVRFDNNGTPFIEWTDEWTTDEWENI